MVPEEALQKYCEKKRSERQGEEERYTHLNAEFQRIARKYGKAFLREQCKDTEKTADWERLELASRKLEVPREHFMQRWAQ